MKTLSGERINGVLKEFILTGRLAAPVTRTTFPIGRPVVVHSFVHTGCGWEFDAPFHAMAPFHLYKEVGSACPEAVDAILEDLLIDLDTRPANQSIAADTNCWPFTNDQLKRTWRRAARGELKSAVLFRSVVKVDRWTVEDSYGTLIQEFDWTIETKEVRRLESFERRVR